MNEINTTSQEINDEYKAEFTKIFREMNLNYICRFIVEFINILGETKEVPTDPKSGLQKQLAEQLADDLMAVAGTVSAIKIFGRP